jgi:hypothetical protein
MTELLYIDPGSGSYVLQVIIAAILGAAFWIKMSWLRIKAFFTGTKLNSEKKDKEKDKGAV